MPGGSASQAVARFLETLQKAVSTVATVKFSMSGGGRRTLGVEHALFSGADAIPLRLRTAGEVQLSLALRYEIVERDSVPRAERFKVSTRWYQHHVLSADGSEVVLFHWHPVTGHGPHVHVGQLGSGGLLTARSHVPSGRVPMEAVLRFLLTELKVRPARADWEQVLDECEADFRRFASWLGHPTLDTRGRS